MLRKSVLLSILLCQIAYAEDRYIIQFADPAASSQLTQNAAAQRDLRAAAISTRGGRIVLDLDSVNAAAAILDNGALASLRADPQVSYVELDRKRYPLAQETPYGIPMVQADLVSDIGAGAVTACIIDSGFDITHPDLAANIVNGTNDPGTGNWFEDGSGHGTHVAGTIAALNNDFGVLGVLPSGTLSLHIVKVFGNDGLWTYSSSLVDAIEVCQGAGASVVNMSLGGGFSSRTEERALSQINDEGVLLIAAAGNDGNTAHSYPASYSSVVSVAAVDSSKNLASFSQRNDQVELAGPGVDVLSSVPSSAVAITAVLTTTIGDIPAEGFQDGQLGSATGNLVDCGLGTRRCRNAAGAICLIQRGTNTFTEKAQNCVATGGIGAVIYNNVDGPINGLIDSSVAIPVAGVSQADGVLLMGILGTSATIDTSIDPDPAGNYDFFSGTSMATPHVTGVAALLWSNHLSCSNADIRNALNMTAEDLGTPGRDNNFGYGLVQVSDASDYLTANGCSGGSPGIEASGQVRGDRLRLTWTGAEGREVELHVNGGLEQTLRNRGSARLSATPYAGQTVDFAICETGGSVCSNNVTLSFPLP